MKKFIYCLLGLLAFFSALAQAQPSVCLPLHGTLHFLSPEPIQYVDISTKNIIGDLPLKNLLRLRIKDSTAVFTDAVVTIAGEKFIAQYHLVPGESDSLQVNILPEDMRPLDISGIGFSQAQLHALSLRLFSQRPDKKLGSAAGYGLKGSVNHIYTAGDYLFLDLSYRNRTNLQYSIDELRFKVQDKKVTKAANSQSVEIKPLYTLFEIPQFQKRYRNIYVFRKISFPGNKSLDIELSEKPISGRTLTLHIAYQDVLDADVISY
jgi:conjugative transposon TraN protein